MKIARIYLRVSTKEQELFRQNKIIEETKNQGYYIANVYKEKASGAREDRPEIQRMINDLQHGDVVIAERMDRISRLPLDEAMALVNSIKSKGAKLSIPDILDLSELSNETDGVTKIVIDSMQELLLKISLQVARDDYELRKKRQKEGIALAKSNNKYKGRKANIILHKKCGQSIKKENEDNLLKIKNHEFYMDFLCVILFGLGALFSLILFVSSLMDSKPDYGKINIRRADYK